MHVGESTAVAHPFEPPEFDGEHVLIAREHKVEVGAKIEAPPTVSTTPTTPTATVRMRKLAMMVMAAERLKTYHALNIANADAEDEYEPAGEDSPEVEEASATPTTASDDDHDAVQSSPPHHGSPSRNAAREAAAGLLSPTQRAKVEEANRRHGSPMLMGLNPPTNHPSSVNVHQQKPRSPHSPHKPTSPRPDPPVARRHQASLVPAAAAPRGIRVTHAPPAAAASSKEAATSETDDKVAACHSEAERMAALIAQRRADRAAFLAERRRAIAGVRRESEAPHPHLETVDFTPYKDPQLCKPSLDATPHIILRRRRPVLGWNDRVSPTYFIEVDGHADTEKVDLSTISFPPGSLFSGRIRGNSNS